MSPNEQEIAEALKGTLIKNLSEDIVCSACEELIKQSYIDCGIKEKVSKKKKEPDTMAQELALTIKIYFTTSTLEEFKIIFRRGASKEFGNYGAKLTLETYYGWIQRYMGLPDRTNAKKVEKEPISEISAVSELNNEVKALEKVPPLESKPKAAKELCLSFFENYKNGNNRPFVDEGNIQYDYLDSQKVIPYTLERKKRFLQAAKVSLSEKGKYGGGDAPRLEAKRIALETFFMELIETGQELQDLFE